MTLKEKFKQLKKANDIKKLNEFMEKYKTLLNVPANDLCQLIIKAFETNAPNLTVNALHEFTPKRTDFINLLENYQNTISTSIIVKDNASTQKIVLIENSSACDESDYFHATYNVNIRSLLMRENLPYAEIIYEACWSAIATNLKTNLDNELSAK